MVSRGGKMIRTEGVELPEDNIVDVQDRYRYLGIPQENIPTSYSQIPTDGEAGPEDATTFNSIQFYLYSVYYNTNCL